ncbi:hypothetical protein Bhyg_14485 [Pseudolycoriella hygida]|uniref:Uncharacterized protein n=1 Tax=Pseudolycoriella hygida TaxID=35572 RepID=A0A9Q0MS20_9DIPT|nr:hypothetical protein Bhyg_14485 [Pseudolycoriella hygida]
MNKNVLFWLIVIGCLLDESLGMVNGDKNATTVLAERETKKLSRHKRYMAFPEGSSLSVAFCATIGYVGNPQFIYFSWSINWGVAYELPNQTWIINHQEEIKAKHKAQLQRRHRRELYHKIEVAIDKMGYNGKHCVLRALCESTQYFYNKGSNMVEELIRTIFSLPMSKVLSFEHNSILEYDLAHRKGRNKILCPLEYPCSFSLIEMALGTYSNALNFM